MKKIIVALVLSTFILSGCGAVQKTANKTAEEKLQESVVIKTGMLTTKSGDEYLLSTTDGIVNITSNKVNLDSYLKKQITVTGMFSGSTLYVDKIETNK
jgi:uncharacterized protein YcfL